MNNYFNKPVLIFGLILPMLILALVSGAVYYGYSKLNKSYLQKKMVYEKAEMARKNTLALQGRVANNNEELQRWNELLTHETRASFVDHWKEAEQKFSGKELTRSSHSWVDYSPGIGRGIEQPSSQVTMSFSATYRAMQAALMEVESKLPQMQLDSITMRPDPNVGRVNFTTKFTLWTKN